MSAYVVVDTKISNPDEYEEYKKLAKPIAEKYDLRENDLWTPTRIVIIEFPDVASARAFADSEEYQPVKAIRLGAAECTLFIVEGA